MRFVGIDLAWSLRNIQQPETGGIVLDDLGQVIAQAHLTTDDAITAFILEHLDADGCIVGIDAPLIVRNVTGRRACEAMLQRVGISAYPANRTLFARTFGGVRGEDLVARLQGHGFVLRAEVLRGETQRSVIEVYPRALIKRMWGAIPPYKVAARSSARPDLAAGMQELQRLMLEQSDPPLVWERPPIDPADGVTLRPRELKRRADLLDAALSAYLGFLAWYGGNEQVETIGDLEGGFIMLPRMTGSKDVTALIARIEDPLVVERIHGLAVKRGQSSHAIVEEILRDWLSHHEQLYVT